MYPHPSMQLVLGGVQVEYLLAGGGGAGEDSVGLAGLGGQVLVGTMLLPRGTYAVTIGAGGNGVSETPGAASSLAALLTALGGAAGVHSGAGVDGTQSSITGSAVYYGSSGGATGQPAGSGAGAGGVGPGVGGSGVANRAGGGGGGADGGNGGSGVFLMRHLGSPAISASGATITTVGSYTLYRFNTSSSFTVA